MLDFEDVTCKGCQAPTQDLNSIRQQTTVPTVCLRTRDPATQLPATQLPKPYLIATNPSTPWTFGSCGRQNVILRGFTTGATHLSRRCLLNYNQQQHWHTWPLVGTKLNWSYACLLTNPVKPEVRVFFQRKFRLVRNENMTMKIVDFAKNENKSLLLLKEAENLCV